MFRNKYFYVILGLFLALALGGAFYWRIDKGRQASEITRTLGSSSGSNSVSLNSNNNSSGGLSVDQNALAANLGQLDTTSNQNGTSGSDTKKASNPFDPTTFAQYEKYKDSQGGLFAEVQKGTGDELVAGKKAVVYYKGWLTDGQLFDQSKPDENGQLQAFAFTLGAHEVIPGWEQALSGMKAGGVRLVIVPPAYGYGEAGQGPVPPNAVLIFQVQLIAVQ